MSDMAYAFHPELGTKCVEIYEYEKLIGEGWYDSPASFPKAGLLADEIKETEEVVIPEVTIEEVATAKKGNAKKGNVKKAA